MILKNITNSTKIVENVIVADCFFKRLRGLMFTKELPPESAMLIYPCSDIHTFFMNYNIDVLYLGKNCEILAVDENLQPGKIGKVRKNAVAVIELSAGKAKEKQLEIGQVVELVKEECDSPVKDEILILLKEMNYGITMEEALNNLNIRMPSSDLELMIQAVLIQRQVGGNLAGVLEIILGTIRDRNRIQRNVRTLTSQGRLSGRVIGLLPLILGTVTFLINPEYIEILFSSTLGVIIITIEVISDIIGFILIHKLTKIEV